MNAYEAAVKRHSDRLAVEKVQKTKDEMKEAALQEAIRQFNTDVAPHVACDILAAVLYTLNDIYHIRKQTMMKIIKRTFELMEIEKKDFCWSNDSETVWKFKHDLKEYYDLDLDELADNLKFKIEVSV